MSRHLLKELYAMVLSKFVLELEKNRWLENLTENNDLKLSKVS